MAEGKAELVKIKWEAIIANMNKELARVSSELKNPERQQELKERWGTLGNHGLVYLYKREKDCFEIAIVQLTSIVEAYEKYLVEVKEIYEEFILLQEQEVIKVHQSDKRGRPRKIKVPKQPRLPQVGDSKLQKEPIMIVKEHRIQTSDEQEKEPQDESQTFAEPGKEPQSFNEPEKEPEEEIQFTESGRRKKKKHTALNKYEIESLVKQAYDSMDVGNRTLGKLHKITPQISRPTLYNYLKKLNYPLDGTRVTRKSK